MVCFFLRAKNNNQNSRGKEKMSATTHKTIRIGAAGPSGGGKSTFFGIIIAILRLFWGLRIKKINIDDYYKDHSSVPKWMRPFLNFDRIEAFDLSALLKDLRALAKGEKIQVRRYDFVTRKVSLLNEFINPNEYDVIFVEGHILFALLTEEQIQELFDITTFVTVPGFLCFTRRLFRDMAVRGRSFFSVSIQYLLTVHPAKKKLIDPSASKAQVQVHSGGYDVVAILEILCRIKEALELDGLTIRTTTPPQD